MKSQSQIHDSTTHMVGQAAGIGLWCLRDGVPLVPMLFQQFEGGFGRRRFTELEPAAALELALAQLEQPPEGCTCAVLVTFDADREGLQLQIRWDGHDPTRLKLAVSAHWPRPGTSADVWDEVDPQKATPKVLEVVGNPPVELPLLIAGMQQPMRFVFRVITPGEIAPGSYFDVSFLVAALHGREVVRWRGFEWALAGGNPVDPTIADHDQEVERTPVVWAHASVPYAQFSTLLLDFSDGSQLQLHATLNEGTGLYLADRIYWHQDDPAEQRPWHISRPRELSDWPRGQIQLIRVREDILGAQIEATLQIGTHQVRLLAAEACELDDGSFRIVEGDESIMVQIDGRAPA